MDGLRGTFDHHCLSYLAMHLPPPETLPPIPPSPTLVTSRRELSTSWGRPVFRAPDLDAFTSLGGDRREPAFLKPRFRPSQRRR